MLTLNEQDLVQIHSLQLLVARAGQSDSLKWWDDESLTFSGAFVLERVFVGAPQRSAQRLALRAAASRHSVALENLPTATHLFHLDAQREIQLALRAVRPPSDIDVESPIADMTALRDRLLSLNTSLPNFELIGKSDLNNTQRIKVSAGANTVLERATALAWAYTVGKVGKPLFPYIVEREK